MVAAEPASAASAFSASYQRSQAMITTKPSSTAYSTPITANLKPATSLLVRSRASGTGRLVRKCMGGERRRADEQVQSAQHRAWTLAAPQAILARFIFPQDPRGARRGPLREHQVRQLDPAHGARAAHDRALRARAGARRQRRPQDRLLRHLQLRLRRALCE